MSRLKALFVIAVTNELLVCGLSKDIPATDYRAGQTAHGIGNLDFDRKYLVLSAPVADNPGLIRTSHARPELIPTVHGVTTTASPDKAAVAGITHLSGNPINQAVEAAKLANSVAEDIRTAVMIKTGVEYPVQNAPLLDPTRLDFMRRVQAAVYENARDSSRQVLFTKDRNNAVAERIADAAYIQDAAIISARAYQAAIAANVARDQIDALVNHTQAVNPEAKLMGAIELWLGSEANLVDGITSNAAYISANRDLGYELGDIIYGDRNKGCDE